MLYALTDFGDSAVLLPVAMLLMVWLFIARSRGAGFSWLCALGLTVVLTGLFKTYFVSCPTAGLRSPSGHTAVSLMVYGGIAVILARERTVKWERFAIRLTGIGLAAAIGGSRVALGKHSEFEVVVGFAIGLSCLAVFYFGYGRSTRTQGGLLTLSVMIAVVLAVLHGRELSFEQLFQYISGRFRIGELACSTAR